MDTTHTYLSKPAAESCRFVILRNKDSVFLLPTT